MAYFREVMDDMWISTWREQKKEVIDNLFDATPFYFWMKKKGRVTEDYTGGEYLTVPLLRGRNATVAMYQKGGSIPISQTDKLDVARYDWKYMVVGLIRYMIDEQINRGRAKIISKMQVELDVAKLSMIELMETYLFGDGSGESGLAFNGLKIICSDTPQTAVASPVTDVGGIDSSSSGNEYWKNVYRDMDTDGPVVSLNMMESWKYAFREAKNGADKPDIFVTTDQILDWYDDECIDIKAIVNKSLGDAGFENLTWRGLPIITSPSCTAGHLYMLNTKYLNWVAQAGANFDMTEWKVAPDTLDRYAQIVVSGNLVTSKRNAQAVVFNID